MLQIAAGEGYVKKTFKTLRGKRLWQ